MSGLQPCHNSALPRAQWRLVIDTAARTGAWNMAIDEAIMDAVAEGSTPPTIRFYQWEPACVSLGKRQPRTSIDVERCRLDGVDIVHRATGGLAILHTDELTYAIAAHPEDPRAEGAIVDSYRRLSQGLVAGLERLGVDAVMQPVDPTGGHNHSAACFVAPSAYELVASGRKLMGSAQTRPYGRLLQHGSLPLTGDIARLANYLEFPSESERSTFAAELRGRATTLEAVLGRHIDFQEAALALADGFTRALNLSLEPATLTTSEMLAARRIAASKATEARYIPSRAAGDNDR